MLTLCVARPTLAVVVMMFAAFTALPAAWPQGLTFAGFSVEFYEPILLTLGAISLMRVPRAIARWVIVALTFLALFGLIGLVRESTLGGVLQDTRRLVLLVLAVPIGWLIAERLQRRAVLVGVTVILWVSAIFTALGSAGLIEVGGRTRAASLAQGMVTSEAAVRMLTSATYLAVAVLCGLIAATLLLERHERGSRFWLVALGAPAALIFVLGFARNAVVALTVATLVSLLAQGRFSRTHRLAMLGWFLVASVLLLSTVRVLGTGTSAGQWMDLQVASFVERVIGGLTPAGISNDNSAQFRFAQENPYLLEGIIQSPVYGHGFGYPYKPAQTGRNLGENSEAFRLYAHNFYLWLPVKTGVIGILFFIGSVVPLLKRAVMARVAVVTAAPLAGLLVASLVAPMPTGSPTSALLGLLAGATFRLTQTSPNPHATDAPCASAEWGPQATGRSSIQQRSTLPRTPQSRARTSNRHGRWSGIR